MLAYGEHRPDLLLGNCTNFRTPKLIFRNYKLEVGNAVVNRQVRVIDYAPKVERRLTKSEGKYNLKNEGRKELEPRGLVGFFLGIVGFFLC